MTRQPALLIVLLGGCAVPAPSDRVDDSAVVDTEVLGDTGSEADTDDAPDTVEPADTDRPTPSGALACYPGPDGRYATCLDVVPLGAWGPDYAYPSPSDARYAAPTHFLDLVTADPATPLARNFRLDELAQAWKGEFGVVQVHLIERLQELRDVVGAPVHVNSGYRNVAYNDGVGGALRSRHMWGDAVDIRTDVMGVQALGAVCETLGAGYVGYYDAHVHCDWRDDTLDETFFQGAPPASLRPSTEVLEASIVRGAVWTAPATGWDEGEPLRQWTATDADGRVLATVTGRTFAPPPGTASVTVVVGRRLTRTVRL